MEASCLLIRDGTFGLNTRYVLLDLMCINSVPAGLDLNCGQYLAAFTQSAINKGKVNESRVDEAPYQVLLVRMRLGMFDGNPANQQFGSLGPKDVCTDAHQELALEAARQSIVLLKNEGNILPLSQNKKIAVIGPNANASHVMLGDYDGMFPKLTLSTKFQV